MNWPECWDGNKSEEYRTIRTYRAIAVTIFQILYFIFVHNNNVDATSEYFPGTDYLLERIVLCSASSQWSFLANH